MRRGALVVFAKRPQPGRVKTRLCPTFTPLQAAELYRAMLADVLEVSAATAARRGLDPWLAVTPADACAELAASCPPAFQVIAQRGPDLAARMDWAVAEVAAGGASPILLRGSDSPALGGATLDAALEALTSHDLVLCPDRDGGYGLVGLRLPAPGLFDHPMSTGSELEDTLRHARRLGLRAHLLEPRSDVDRVEDLRWLAEQRERSGGAECPRTLAYLDSERLWPARP